MRRDATRRDTTQNDTYVKTKALPVLQFQYTTPKYDICGHLQADTRRRLLRMGRKSDTVSDYTARRIPIFYTTRAQDIHAYKSFINSGSIKQSTRPCDLPLSNVMMALIR